MTFSYRSQKTGEQYYLNKKVVTLRSKKEQDIYFFSKAPGKPEEQAVMPEGYTVWENPASGMPLIKKQRSQV